MVGKAAGGDYFLSRWMGTLGTEATCLVLALRQLADEQGIIHASQAEIAALTGLSERTVRRWLGTAGVARFSVEDARRHELLHRHFIAAKSRRYAPQARGGASRIADEIRVALDNPTHPGDIHTGEIRRNGNRECSQLVTQDEADDEAVVTARNAISALYTGEARRNGAERIPDGAATEFYTGEIRRNGPPVKSQRVAQIVALEQPEEQPSEVHTGEALRNGHTGEPRRAQSPDPDLLRSVSESDSGRHFKTPLSGSDPKSRPHAGTGSTFLKRAGTGTDLIYDPRPKPPTPVADSASKQGMLWRDPRVTRLSQRQIDAAKLYADEIGCWLDEKSGKEPAGLHSYRRLHLAAIFFLGAKYTREAQMAVDDDLANARAGRRAPIGNPSRYFWGVCRGKAKEYGIDLKADDGQAGVRGGRRPSDRAALEGAG